MHRIPGGGVGGGNGSGSGSGSGSYGGAGPGGVGDGVDPAQYVVSSAEVQPAAVRFAESDSVHMVHAVFPSFCSGAQSALSLAKHWGSIAASQGHSSTSVFTTTTMFKLNPGTLELLKQGGWVPWAVQVAGAA